MKLETKFNFGERVYPIYHGREDYREVCEVCNGTGKVTLGTKNYDCPESGCYGEGFIIKTRDTAWFLDNGLLGSFVVQKIGMELHNPNNKLHSHNRSWTYIMAANSGTMWNELDCFLTEDEAKQECIKRNTVNEIRN